MKIEEFTKKLVESANVADVIVSEFEKVIGNTNQFSPNKLYPLVVEFNNQKQFFLASAKTFSKIFLTRWGKQGLTDIKEGYEVTWNTKGKQRTFKQTETTVLYPNEDSTPNEYIQNYEAQADKKLAGWNKLGMLPNLYWKNPITDRTEMLYFSLKNKHYLTNLIFDNSPEAEKRQVWLTPDEAQNLIDENVSPSDLFASLPPNRIRIK